MKVSNKQILFLKVKVLTQERALQQRQSNLLNLNCSSNSSCFFSFCSCSRSKRERGSYSSSGASDNDTNFACSIKPWMIRYFLFCFSHIIFVNTEIIHTHVYKIYVHIGINIYLCVLTIYDGIINWTKLMQFLLSGSSGFRTFSHSSCLFCLLLSSSASETNFLLRSTPASPPPAIRLLT